MKPKFVPVDLTELMMNGVLMAANERFFWPLGLALTWDYDKETATASNLHVREWEYEDGHHESIGLATDDEVANERRQRFVGWAHKRLTTMPPEEQALARALLSTPATPEVTT